MADKVVVKRMLSFALAAVFLISVLATPGSAFSNTSSVVALEQSAVEKQTATTTACMALFDSFAKTRSGDLIYPDDYGGVYQKDGELHICLTSNSPSSISRYSAATQNSDCVVYDQVDYSYRTLRETADYIADNMFGTLDVTYVAIIDDGNSIEVGLKPECADTTQNDVVESVNTMLNNYLGTENYDYRDVLTFVNDIYGYEDGEARLTAEEVSALTQSVSDSRTVVTLYGGDYIYCNVDGGYSWSSVTIGGYIGTVPGMLSCGHGKTSGMTIYSNAARTNVIGTVLINQYVHNQAYDYSLIQANSNYSPNQTIRTYTGTSTPGLTTIYNSWTAIEGDTVFTYGHGAYSGAYGIVKSTYCSTYDDEDNVTITGITKVERLGGWMQGGDSGAPVYAGAAIYGCHRGAAKDENQTYFYFSPGLGGLTFTAG